MNARVKSPRRWRPQRRRFTLLLIGLCSTWAIASYAQSVGVRPIVYVADFELDAADVKSDDNRVDRARGLVRSLRPLGGSSSDDPQAHAQRIVSSLSAQLMSDLQKAGFDARHVDGMDPLPANGWLVRGVFLSVDEGNRLKRAVVGFGAGQETIELAVAIDNLSSMPPAPLYQTIEGQSSEHKPGAAVTLNPYVAAAKFVLAKGDEHKTIVDTAQKVSDEVVRRANAGAAAQ
ncbi:MAG TPA: DUF4410 domain-containing protein [Pararobbsia sp.]|nr:DUF4410 domain-containing protein [Pararobbsia sp.]